MLVIIYQLVKIIYFKSINDNITTPTLIEVIIYVIVYHFSFANSMIIH